MESRRGRILVMVRAWACREKLFPCFALVLLTNGCVIAGAAQQQSKATPSAPSPWLIVLPPKLVAGANATLAVLDHQGRLMPDIDVTLSSGLKVTTDVTGRATFNVNDMPGKLRAVSAAAVAASADVISANELRLQVQVETVRTGANIISYPRILATHDRFTLTGAGFRGDADWNHVSLNGDPCLVLAASPATLVVLPGAKVPVGDATLRVEVGGGAAQFPVSVVLLEFSGPAEAVSAGASGQLVLRARGTTEPLAVEVRNASPDVIQLTKGNLQRVKTSGGEDNTVPVDVKFVTAGNYVVSARLVSSGSRPADSDSAKKHLAQLKER